MKGDDRTGQERSGWREACARYEAQEEREWQKTCKIFLLIYLSAAASALVGLSFYWMAAGLLRSGLVLASMVGLMITVSELVLTIFEPNPADFGTLEG